MFYIPRTFLNSPATLRLFLVRRQFLPTFSPIYPRIVTFSRLLGAGMFYLFLFACKPCLFGLGRAQPCTCKFVNKLLLLYLSHIVAFLSPTGSAFDGFVAYIRLPIYGSSVQRSRERGFKTIQSSPCLEHKRARATIWNKKTLLRYGCRKNVVFFFGKKAEEQ